LTAEGTLAAEYVKAHARNVIAAGPETPLHEIAVLLEKNCIKRVPILFTRRVLVMIWGSHLRVGLCINGPEAQNGETEEHASNKRDDRELRPDHIDTCTAVKD